MTIPITTPRIRGTMHPGFDEILTPDALAFLARLDGAFAGRRAQLLAGRRERARRIAAGEDLGFLPDTAHVRADTSWRVADPAPGLRRRWVGITGPATRTMAVDALDSGADVWMADLADATAPTWRNIIDGQRTLHHALRGGFGTGTTDGSGKSVRLGGTAPTVVLQPRGWHLCEKHITIDSRPLSASLVDFGLYFFHNAHRLIDTGAGPYFSLPKLESHLEARLWNDVFVLAQDLLDIPRGTVRATVSIETLPAALEMDEILYELREHAAGLNAGRQDYIFSYVRTFAQRGPDHVLPDHGAITMSTPFLHACAELLVATCHRRGALAIGDKTALAPDGSDPDGRRALAGVLAEKRWEAGVGFDGSWVAHPRLAEACREAFRAALGERDDQRERVCPEVFVTAEDLTAVRGRSAVVTLDGVRANVSAAMRYLSMWIGGSGTVTVDAVLADAATAEVSRAQLWQWIANRTRLAEGPAITGEMVESMVHEEAGRLIADGRWGSPEQVRGAVDVLTEVALRPDLPGFFTPYAYVRYLTEKPLRMTGPLAPDDLRMSERVAGVRVDRNPDGDEAAA